MIPKLQISPDPYVMLTFLLLKDSRNSSDSTKTCNYRCTGDNYCCVIVRSHLEIKLGHVKTD